MANSSATTRISLGPATMSMPHTSEATSLFAVATKMLPGPVILSTRGTLSVPYARAAMACAPPALRILLTPHMCAAASTSGLTLPSAFTGVAIMTSCTPAILAGMAFMSTVEGYAAVPPGMYSPARRTGIMRSPRITPGRRISNPSLFCSLWNSLMLSMLCCKVWMYSSSKEAMASRISSSVAYSSPV